MKMMTRPSIAAGGRRFLKSAAISALLHSSSSVVAAAGDATSSVLQLRRSLMNEDDMMMISEDVLKGGEGSSCGCSHEAFLALQDAHSDIWDDVPFIMMGLVEKSKPILLPGSTTDDWTPREDYHYAVEAVTDIKDCASYVLDCIDCGSCEEGADDPYDGISHFECCCDVGYVLEIAVERMRHIAHLVSLNPFASAFTREAIDSLKDAACDTIYNMGRPYDCPESTSTTTTTEKHSSTTTTTTEKHSSTTTTSTTTTEKHSSTTTTTTKPTTTTTKPTTTTTTPTTTTTTPTTTTTTPTTTTTTPTTTTTTTTPTTTTTTTTTPTTTTTTPTTTTTTTTTKYCSRAADPARARVLHCYDTLQGGSFWSSYFAEMGYDRSNIDVFEDNTYNDNDNMYSRPDCRRALRENTYDLVVLEENNVGTTIHPDTANFAYNNPCVPVVLFDWGSRVMKGYHANFAVTFQRPRRRYLNFERVVPVPGGMFDGCGELKLLDGAYQRWNVYSVGVYAGRRGTIEARAPDKNNAIAVARNMNVVGLGFISDSIAGTSYADLYCYIERILCYECPSSGTAGRYIPLENSEKYVPPVTIEIVTKPLSEDTSICNVKDTCPDLKDSEPILDNGDV